MPINVVGGPGHINGIHARRARERSVLYIAPPSDKPDGFVKTVLVALENRAAPGRREPEKYVEDVAKLLEKLGLNQDVGKASTRLSGSGLDRTQRLLLSSPALYASILDHAITKNGKGDPEPPEKWLVDFKDTESLADFVVRTLNANGGLREAYVKGLIEQVVEILGLQPNAEIERRVLKDLLLSELPIPAPKVEELIGGLLKSRRATNSIEEAVNTFASTPDLDPVRLTRLKEDERLRGRMVAFLKDLGVKFPAKLDPADRDKFDEYFALAYNQAIRAGDGATVDPIDAVRQKGALTDWDFTVDPFDTVEEQGVVTQNILAAGALDYVYDLGERLGMFKLADALVLRWASGTFDAEAGKPSADLYRYWKLRSERISPEERGMMYRRILMKGDGKLLSGMVENAEFPALWGRLMENVTEYIRRAEESGNLRPVSRQPIYQATKQLQYNLTEHATGMAHMQITEMYHHLIEAKTVLEHAIPYFSTGSRKSLWTVIERASREWFEEAPNIAAIRSAAVDGNKVFQWIANFDQATVTDEQFQTFLEAAEAWILAQAADSGVPPSAEEAEDEEEDEDDLEAEVDRMADDDSDWDK
jgi:hypothetical protein